MPFSRPLDGRNREKYRRLRTHFMVVIRMDNRCVVCGEVIPEGRQVCPICEADVSGRPIKNGEAKKGNPVVFLRGLIRCLMDQNLRRLVARIWG
jgi:hypothetical protein